MVVEDVRVLPQVSKRHGGECAQPPSAYTHSPIMNLYISCPLPSFSISYEDSVQTPTAATDPTWHQNCNQRKLALQCKSIHSTHISLTPNNKTIKNHAHHTTITTSPPPSRTPRFSRTTYTNCIISDQRIIDIAQRNATSSPLLRLPPEIRNMIYTLIIHVNTVVFTKAGLGRGRHPIQDGLALLRVFPYEMHKSSRSKRLSKPRSRNRWAVWRHSETKGGS
jgi:hypothetical protein